MKAQPPKILLQGAKLAARSRNHPLHHHRSANKKVLLIDGVPEIPVPGFPPLEVVSDDEAEPSESGNLDALDRSKSRRELQELKQRNARRAARRRAAEVERQKRAVLHEKRAKFREEVHVAIAYEDIPKMEMKLKQAAALGLEGKDKSSVVRGGIQLSRSS